MAPVKEIHNDTSVTDFITDAIFSATVNAGTHCMRPFGHPDQNRDASRLTATRKHIPKGSRLSDTTWS